MDIVLDKVQSEALDLLESGSILCGGVGSGKSRTALAYFFRNICGGNFTVWGVGESKPPTNPTKLYVITTAKKRDSFEWELEAADFHIYKSETYGGISMTVDSWNNISRYKNVHGAFFIFDEQRVVGSGKWVKTFLNIARKNKWILLTATPGDTWSDYIPVFVANGFYKNRTDFQEQHVVYDRWSKFPKVKGYVGTRKLERNRRAILVDMIVERHTKRHYLTIPTSYDIMSYKTLMKTRWHPRDHRPIRDVAELIREARYIVNTDPSKQRSLLDILERKRKVIVFYNFNYELDILKGTIPEGWSCAEWNGHKHEDIPNGDRWVYLVQYTAGAEGWNCTTTDTIVFYSLSYSYKVIEQACGRIDRRNTPFTNLEYYFLESKSPIDIAIRRAVNQKRLFNESAFMRKKG